MRGRGTATEKWLFTALKVFAMQYKSFFSWHDAVKNFVSRQVRTHWPTPCPGPTAGQSWGMEWPSPSSGPLMTPGQPKPMDITPQRLDHMTRINLQHLHLEWRNKRDKNDLGCLMFSHFKGLMDWWYYVMSHWVFRCSTCYNGAIVFPCLFNGKNSKELFPLHILQSFPL